MQTGEMAQGVPLRRTTYNTQAASQDGKATVVGFAAEDGPRTEVELSEKTVQLLGYCAKICPCVHASNHVEDQQSEVYLNRIIEQVAQISHTWALNRAGQQYNIVVYLFAHSALGYSSRVAPTPHN